MRLPFFWCGKRDLNPYGVNHTPLKRARLPVPPLPRVRLARNILYYTLFFQNVKCFFKKNQNFSEIFFLKTIDKIIPFVYNIEVVNRRHNLCGYGGIGRRARFRFQWGQLREGSSPFTRTNRKGIRNAYPFSIGLVKLIVLRAHILLAKYATEHREKQIKFSITFNAVLVELFKSFCP